MKALVVNALGGGFDFEGHGAGLRIPRFACEECCGAVGGIEEFIGAGNAIRERERAHGIAGDLGRDILIETHIGAMISRHAAIGKLYARPRQPKPSGSKLR